MDQMLVAKYCQLTVQHYHSMRYLCLQCESDAKITHCIQRILHKPDAQSYSLVYLIRIIKHLMTGWPDLAARAQSHLFISFAATDAVKHTVNTVRHNVK